MERTVFGDLLFFVNFCMDFQCMFLTAKLLRRRFLVFRAAIFSALGAVYAVAALFLEVPGVVAFFCDLAVCFLMCTGVFFERTRSLGGVPLPFLLYFGVSFAVGGVMSGMATLLSRLQISGGVASGGTLSSGAFYVLAAAGGISTYLWGRFCRHRAANDTAQLHISLAGQTLTVTAMVDTANLLTDPVSGHPVVLLSPHAVKRVFPPPLQGVTAETLERITALPDDLARRVRVLCADTATGTGLLVAVSPDRVLLDRGKGATPTQVLLAAAPLRLHFTDCEALLPAELLTE